MLLAPSVVALVVVLPCCRFSRRKLDLEAIIHVMDDGTGARHGLHRRVLELEALLQVASHGVGTVELLVGGGLLLGKPTSAQSPRNAGGDGEEGDDAEHGEHRPERAPGRGGRLRMHDGVGGRVIWHGLR